MSRRRRSAAVSASAVVAVLAVGALAVGGVVWFLSEREPALSRQRCAATLDGADWYLTTVQSQNAALIVGTSIQRDLPARAATIGVATALQESSLVNIDYGDRDSLGLFQQRPSQGWGTPAEIMDPVYSTNAFYDGLVEVDGWQDMEVTVAAQAVQRSAFPEAYAQHETRSRAWASALTGHSPGSLTCQLFAVTEDEPVDLVDRLRQDLGIPADAVTAVEPDADEVRQAIDATTLGYEDPDRSVWAVAHWAVATASVTDVVEVRAGDQVWTRADAVWAPLDDSADPTSADQVLVAVGSPPG
ncbi:hypothetical protein GCM10009718_05660 [Isoptericola halotolerans]|uniref:Heavy metal transporter n=1 Tax=Isoptericola halotolerans TaxID=300560 RepID=A0ABX2A418_9MICO|nr:hypothetical protein [Isoptericola halotolerans]NOV96512.1 hypothetical protein [Isoptericola halotolerans]